MFVQQLYSAIQAAHLSNLDQTAKLVWQGLAAGLLSDEEAEGLGTAIEARREAIRSHRVSTPRKSRKPLCEAPRGRRIHSKSMERRRRLATSGAVPSTIAHNFTLGELAVLSVVGRQVQRIGRCLMFMDQLAAIAGVSRTTARNALRLAERLGMIAVEERRISGNRNDSNVITIISKEWITWLGLAGGGGCKNLPTTNNHLYLRDKSRHRVREFTLFQGQDQAYGRRKDHPS